LSQPYVNPEGLTLQQCVFCGFCERYACEHYAKSSPQTILLPVLLKSPNYELWVHLWLGAALGGCAFSISARHKLKNALMMIGTIGPLELAGLAATYASTCRTRSVSVELARHRWKAVLTG